MPSVEARSVQVAEGHCKTECHGRLAKDYGDLALTSAQLTALLPEEARKGFSDALSHGVALNKNLGNAVAKVVYGWALERGVKRYAHVFYPINRPPAFKYNTFANVNFGQEDWTVPLELVSTFTGTQLSFNETDGSSFPNGGLRETHVAAAYNAWDRSATMWIKGDTLFIPTILITWRGHAEDEKLPLLRSQQAVDHESVRLLHLLGHKEVKKVVSHVGVEQEFFLVDREKYIQRLDLVNCGRTLLGAAPANGQQFSDNYFAEPNPRVQAFFKEFQEECYKRNISYTVGHNEVAPSQHEWSPVFTLANLAADTNNLAMGLMGEVAKKHGLVCLCHEKPFKGINGNGKHNNWSIGTDTGKNLFLPGANEKDDVIFMAFVAALTRAVRTHGDVLRAGVATPGNDHRLGAHEAPPAIISLYLGQGLHDFVTAASEGGVLTGYGRAGRAEAKSIPTGATAVGPVPGSGEDRNRTAPFPYCGQNRFEFRAVGGAQNISWPITCLHAAVADSVRYMADKIESGEKADDVIRQVFRDNRDALFAGNGYSQEWHAEAERRGLPNLRDTIAAADRLDQQKNIELFGTLHIYNRDEVLARQEAIYENYAATLLNEAATLSEIIQTQLLPAARRDLESGMLLQKNRMNIYERLEQEGTKLSEIIAKAKAIDGAKEAAHFARDVVKPALSSARVQADAAEGVMDKKLWPLPRYSEMLFEHHSEAPRD